MTCDICFICHVNFLRSSAVSLIKLCVGCIKTLNKLGWLSTLVIEQNGIFDLISWDSVAWLAFGSNISNRSSSLLVWVVAILNKMLSFVSKVNWLLKSVRTKMSHISIGVSDLVVDFYQLFFLHVDILLICSSFLRFLSLSSSWISSLIAYFFHLFNNQPLIFRFSNFCRVKNSTLLRCIES